MYDPSKIEPKWQEYWVKNKTFKCEVDKTKEKYYVLDMFPYPSGAGLHVGHPEGYTATDIICRYKRMKGFNVLHPMGWDAFGLPAENYAIKTGRHPREVTDENIATFKRQIQAIGFSYDWDREVDTTDPDYYKWTQWIFLQLYKKGLAYESELPINWCPSCKTGIANEEVVDGKCERCGEQTTKKLLRQWVLKITDYADRLVEDLKDVDWPEPIKIMQENWVGKSYGANVDFDVKGSDEKVRVYTTRPDTLFGATYMVLSPEHPLVYKLVTDEYKEAVEKYKDFALMKSDLERTDLNKDKTGQFTGAYAINPANGKEIPIWIADYVLMGYGTGAIMAVPAHDERDFEFRMAMNKKIEGEKEKIDIQYVVEPDFVSALNFCFYAFEKSVGKFDRKNIDHWYNLGSLLFYLKKMVEKESFDITIKNSEKLSELSNFFSYQTSSGNLPKLEMSSAVTDLAIWWSKYSERMDQIKKDFFAEKIGQREYFKFENKVLSEVIQNNKICELLYEEKITLPITHNHLFKNNLKIGVYSFEGVLINSDFLNDSNVEDAKFKMIRHLEEEGIGEGAVNYKLKDWVFSRQRYWGEPIPIVHCEKCGAVPVPEEELPLLLPKVKNYQPTGTGQSPLADIEEWVNCNCPKCSAAAKRETNTMPQWGGSCWYYLRYISPKNAERFVNEEEEKYWMNVNLYVGGAEHAVLHLLYARFWHKVLFDLGFVRDKEPFQRLMNQGLILGEDGEKMSKSRGNVINPDDVIKGYGADTLRLYEMFMGPFEAVKPWSTKNIEGCFRFLQKVWKLVEEKEVTDECPTDELRKLFHKTIKKVGEDIEGFRFNTAISQMMIFANEFQKQKTTSKPLMEKFTKILSPFAPHLAEELWSMLGHSGTLAYEPWPEYDPAFVVDSTFELVFSVNGKPRGKKEVAIGISNEEAIAQAKADPAVQRHLEGKEILKEIVVPNKLVNIVVKG